MSRERRQGDRRTDPRVPIELWIEQEDGDALYFQRAANLSVGGVFFSQTIPHEAGTIARLRFVLPEDPQAIECAGKIVANRGSEDGLGMGVRFVDLGAEDRRRIELLVSRLGT